MVGVEVGVEVDVVVVGFAEEVDQGEEVEVGLVVVAVAAAASGAEGDIRMPCNFLLIFNRDLKTFWNLFLASIIMIGFLYY